MPGRQNAPKENKLSRAVARQPARRGFSAFLFMLALAVYLAGSVNQTMNWGTVAYLHELETSEYVNEQRPYNCKSDSCVRCLSAIEKNADQIIFTGSSTQVTAINTSAISTASGRPVVNCGIGGSRMEDFSMILNKEVKTLETQIFFHGYTYWEVNNPEPRYFGFLPKPQQTMIRKIVDRFATYTEQAQYDVRVRLAQKGVPLHLLGAPFLSEETWLDAREHAQRRSFRFALFGDGTVGESTEMESRLQKFIESLRPFRRLVFFTSPDYRSLIHGGTDPKIIDVVDNAIAKIAATHQNVEFIKLSAETCGLNRNDFWVPTAWTLDPFHPTASGMNKFTPCFLEAVVARDLLK